MRLGSPDLQFAGTPDMISACRANDSPVTLGPRNHISPANMTLVKTAATQPQEAKTARFIGSMV